MTQEPYYTTLKNRGQLRISGIDKDTFLQGLISNDINLLKSQECIYSCLLTPQGKFLYDFFITASNDTLLLDCEGNARALDFAKLLNMYKLRADIEIKVIESIPTYGVIGSEDFGYKDPRHTDMGYRTLSPPTTLPEMPFEYWDKHRIALTIPDGSRDMIPNKSTMDEGRMDTLNTISYDKGCYIGQELTARMHYRGLGKKHLQTIQLNALPDKAELRSTCGDIGIALLKN